MKRNLRRWYGYWATFFSSLLFCDLVFAAGDNAAGGNSSPLWDMFANLTFTPSVHDASVRLLAKLFGRVPGISGLLDAGGDTLIGLVLGLFNTGILAISGVFLCYTITKILTETSMDGSTMGKSSTLWTAIRCSLGTSLVVPTTGGYSIINGVVMWVVLQGVGLANLVWDKAVDTLNKQNDINSSSVIVNSSSVIANSSSVIVNSIGNKNFSADLSLVDYSLDSNRDVTAKRTDENNIGSADLLRSLCCSYAVRQALTEELDPSPNRSQIIQNISLYNKDSTTHQSTRTVYTFPYISENVITEILKKKKKESTLTVQTLRDYNGACGKYELESDTNVISSYEGIIDYSLDKLSNTASQLINGTNGKPPQKPKDFAIYDSGKTTIHLNELRQEPYSDVYASFLTRVNELTYPLGTEVLLETALNHQAAATAINSSNKENSALIQELAKQMTENGWINAGSYYNYIDNLQTALKKLSAIKRLTAIAGDRSAQNSNDAIFNPKLNDTATPRLNNAYKWIYYSVPLVKLFYKKKIAEIESNAPKIDETSLLKTVQSKIDAFIKKTDGSKTKINAYLISAGVAIAATPITAATVAIPLLIKVLDGIFTCSVNTILTAWNENAGQDDPIMRLKHLGDAMVTAAIDGFHYITKTFTTISASSVAGSAIYRAISLAAAPGSMFGATTGTVEAMNGWSDFFHEVASLIQAIIFVRMPLLIAVLGPIFVSGITLSVYVPAIPYLLFLFGSLSWILAVLIVMVAAPVICFLMLWGGSSQDNPLLSREAEQFVMQLLGVFLRPTLMIVGLIAGVFIARAGVDLLNLGFEQFFNMILDGTDMTATLPKIKLATVMVIYTFVMVSVVNMSFSAIHLLYSETMRIAGINAPAGGQEERQLESVKGSVQKLGEAGSSGAREGIAGVRHSGRFNSHVGSDRTSMEERKGANAGKGKGASGDEK